MRVCVGACGVCRWSKWKKLNGLPLLLPPTRDDDGNNDEIQQTGGGAVQTNDGPLVEA